MTMKFYRFITAFRFLKEKKSKKLVVALKFLYFLTVLSLNPFFFFASFICLKRLLSTVLIFKEKEPRDAFSAISIKNVYLVSLGTNQK